MRIFNSVSNTHIYIYIHTISYLIIPTALLVRRQQTSTRVLILPVFCGTKWMLVRFLPEMGGHFFLWFRVGWGRVAQSSHEGRGEIKMTPRECFKPEKRALFKWVLIRVFLLNFLNLFCFMIYLKWWNWAHKKYEKIYETYFFCVVECGTRSLSRGVLWYLLKVVLEAKNRPPPKNVIFVFLFFFLSLF